MANRYDEFLKVRTGEDVDDDFFNRRYRDLDNRLDPLERRAFSEDLVLQTVQDRVLARSEAVIASLRDQLVQITQLEFLTGHSGTERTLVEGQSISFIIDPADRALFAPGPWSVIGRDSTPDDYAIVRGLAYDRDLGQFDVTVFSVVGNPGPHHDWSIAAVAGSTLAQLVLLGQGKAARDAALAAISVADDNVVATGEDRIATSADRQAVHDDRVASQAARAGAEAAAINARLFDPSSYYTKDVGDGRYASKGSVDDRFTALAGGVSAAHDTLGEIEADLAAKAAAITTNANAVATNAAAINALKALPTASLDDVRILAIQLAKVKGSTVGMAGGVADDFKDQTGIDTANSINAFYDVGGTVGNYLAGTDDLAPMTSNSAPSGQTAAATDETYAQAYRVFDGSATTAWAIQAQSGTVSRTSTAARMEAAYAVTYNDGGGLLRAPKTWTRWGSNDGGTTRVTLDTQASQTGWSQGERRTFVIPVGNRAAFKTYGFTFTNNQGDNFSSIAAIESLLAGSGVMDLRSAAFPAQAVPTKGSIFVLVRAASDMIVANTNLIAKLSRDGGTSYTTATLTSTGALSSGYVVYEANGFDLTAQPSGSSMKWRLQTVGAALTIQVDAVVAQWG